jgi:lysozyme
MSNLIDQLKFEEGLRLNAYRCPAGKLTIGYGHNLEANPYLEGNRIPQGITADEAEVILHIDLDLVVEALDNVWHGFLLLDPVRRDACVNMAFQLGIKGFMNFEKMRGHLIRCDWQKAYTEGHNSLWAKQCPHRADRVLSQLLTGVEYSVPGLVHA